MSYVAISDYEYRLCRIEEEKKCENVFVRCVWPDGMYLVCYLPDTAVLVVCIHR